MKLRKKHIKKASQIYYEKYPYKLTLHVPAGPLRSHIYGWSPSKEEYDHSHREAKRRSEGGRYYRGLLDAYENCSYYDITHLAAFIIKNKKKIRHRIEYDSLSIFVETKEELDELVSGLKPDCVKAAFMPTDENQLSKLIANTIYLKNPKFKFKVKITDGYYESDEKAQLTQYINNYPAEAFKFSSQLGYRLFSDGPYNRYLGGYFYVNDDSVLTFLRMINPRFVKRIHPIEKL
jgi:hypothetical protein